MNKKQFELPDEILEQLLPEVDIQKLCIGAVVARQQSEEDISKVINWATNVVRDYHLIELAKSGYLSLYISENGDLKVKPIIEQFEKIQEVFKTLPV